MAYRPETQGELAAMPTVRKHQMILGVVLGSIVAGLFTFSLFGVMIRSLNYPNGGLLSLMGAAVGLIAGAAFGPILIMILRKKTIRKIGL